MTIVETQRLILREITIDDLDGMYELDSDPEVHTYLGKQSIKSKDERLKVIGFIRQQYHDNGIGRWAVILKDTNEFIGWTGLKYITYPINNHVNFHELGYRLIRRYWGQGFATESALASLEYAFERLGINEVYAMAECENMASNKILEKVSFQFVEEFEYDGILHNWYVIKKSTSL